MYTTRLSLIRDTKATVLPIGDSLTLGFPFEPGYPQYIRTYFMDKPLAKGGWTINEALENPEKNLHTNLKAILFWLGVNDELQHIWSISNYIKADKLLKELAPGAKIIYGGLPEVPKLPLAYHRNLELIYAGFNPLLFKLNAKDIWQDGLHLTQVGYKKIALAWESRLKYEGI